MGCSKTANCFCGAAKPFVLILLIYRHRQRGDYGCCNSSCLLTLVLQASHLSAVCSAPTRMFRSNRIKRIRAFDLRGKPPLAASTLLSLSSRRRLCTFGSSDCRTWASVALDRKNR